ncbi:uncharacterized protein LOC122318178 isoform X3 [Carya illinoinensis]|uniref:uncharacterized protein LOC122318178 isoform X3 n=1 Tax=Carya illinoinensis TaxID=32201 RepID=UPI001C722A65|nr:uncharacterized protein LOC122318178 isoform X3 [Carya illinoinensis]
MNHSSSCAAVPHSILQTHELNQCITFHRFIPQFRIVVTPLTESRAQWLTRISSVNPAHLTSPSFPVLTSHFRVLYFLVEICNIYFVFCSLQIVKKLLDFSTCIHKAIREAFGNNDEFGSR